VSIWASTIGHRVVKVHPQSERHAWEKKSFYHVVFYQVLIDIQLYSYLVDHDLRSTASSICHEQMSVSTARRPNDICPVANQMMFDCFRRAILTSEIFEASERETVAAAHCLANVHSFCRLAGIDMNNVNFGQQATRAHRYVQSSNYDKQWVCLRYMQISKCKEPSCRVPFSPTLPTALRSASSRAHLPVVCERRCSLFHTGSWLHTTTSQFGPL